MKIFHNKNPLKFSARFKTYVNTLYLLTSVKSSDSYSSYKYVHIKTLIHKNLSRISNTYKSLKSPIVNILFHHISFWPFKTFYVCSKMADSTKINIKLKKFDLANLLIEYLTHKKVKRTNLVNS